MPRQPIASKAPRTYSAFISYRHADNTELGRQWATWLHEALENYQLPEELVGNVNPDETVVPDTLYPVFRDEEELPAGADLSQNIRRALENSHWLVVLCSPRAVESQYVTQEIRYFKELGKAEHILALMIDGEPNASSDPGKAKLGITPEMECLPESLRFGVKTADKLVDWTHPTEPIAADTRPEGRAEQGWTTAARYRKELIAAGTSGKAEIAHKVELYEKQLENAKLKVIAGIIGVPLGILTERDEAAKLKKAQRQAQVRRRWLAAVGLFALLAVAGGSYAWKQTRVAIQQRKAALKTASDTDFSEGDLKLKARDVSAGLMYLASSLRNNPSNFAAATRLISVARNLAWPTTKMQHEGMYQHSSFSPDSKRILSLNNKTAQIQDAQTGKVVGGLMQHDKPVRWAAFSPDGKRVATASEDNTARVWDAESGKPIGETIPHHGAVGWVEFSPDSKWVVTASEDKTARVWDAETGQPVSKPMHHDGVLYMAEFSPDGKRVLTSGSDMKARLWDAESGEPVGKPYAHGDTFAMKAVFSPDSKRIATVTSDNRVHIWDVETGQAVGKPIVHRKQVLFVQFSPDGKSIITASADKTARMSEVQTGKPLGPQAHHGGSIFCANFSPDGLWVASASADGSVQVWESRTGRVMGAPLRHEGPVLWVEFSPDGRWLVSTAGDKTTRVWSLPSIPTQPQPMRHGEGLFGASYSPDGRHIVTQPLNKAQIWDLPNARPVGAPIANEGALCKPSFSPDGKWILTINKKTARVSDAQTGQPVGATMSHDDVITWAEFSPDGKRVVTASRDKTARIWDTESGNSVGEPMSHDDAAVKATFSPDGKWILTLSSDGAAGIWNAASTKREGAPLRQEKAIRSAAFTADATQVITLAEGSVRFWKVPGGKASGETTLGATPAAIGKFSPDGDRILIGSHGNSAQVWDTHTGKAVGEAMHHDDRLNEMNFSPDGNWIVTASQDKTARLWSAWTGKIAGEPMRHALGVSGADFSADGKSIVTASWDKSAQIWDTDAVGTPAPDWLVQLAEFLSGQRLNARKLPEPANIDPAQLREKLAKLKGNDELSRFGRWFVSDRTTRTTSPFSEVTVPEILAQRLKENTLESLVKAYQLDPGNPLVVAALAKFDPDRDRAMFLCRYALEHAGKRGTPETVEQVRAVTKTIFPDVAAFQ